VARALSVRERLGTLRRWESGLVVLAIAVAVLGATSSDQFLTSRNLFYLSLNVGEVAIMALPLTLIIIAGEIDLSVASTAGMASALLGWLWGHGWPMPLIFIAVLGAGAAAGLVNGLLITRLGLPSLAVTIGTLTLYRGIALIILGPNTVANFPAGYTQIGIVPLPGTPIPFSVAVFLGLALIFGVVLHATPLGRSIYAIGANKEAALYSGVRVRSIKTRLYVLSGVLCSLAGMLLTFRLATAISNNAVGFELDAVAVVLFAGVSIFGGRGSILGVVLAVFTFGAIQNALLLINFDERAAGIVTGGLLLASVLVPNLPSFAGRTRAGLGLGRAGRARETPTATAPPQRPGGAGDDLMVGRGLGPRDMAPDTTQWTRPVSGGTTQGGRQ
jgi:rhamnose transport system permease protein